MHQATQTSRALIETLKRTIRRAAIVLGIGIFSIISVYHGSKLLAAMESLAHSVVLMSILFFEMATTAVSFGGSIWGAFATAFVGQVAVVWWYELNLRRDEVTPAEARAVNAIGWFGLVASCIAVLEAGRQVQDLSSSPSALIATTVLLMLGALGAICLKLIVLCQRMEEILLAPPSRQRFEINPPPRGHVRNRVRGGIFSPKSKNLDGKQ